MKKAFSCAVLVLLFSPLSFPQGVVTGFEFAFPAGDFADSTRTGVGGYFTVDFELTSSIMGHVSTGFLYFAGRESYLGGYGMFTVEYTAVPIQAGVKLKTDLGLYGLLEAGIHIWTRSFEEVSIYDPVDQSETEIKPGFSAGGGYELYLGDEYAVDLAAKYQWLDSHGYLSGRLGIIFVL